MYDAKGLLVGLCLLGACAPRLDRFVVHSGTPGSAGTALPAPAPGKNLVFTADVTPFHSNTAQNQAKVVLQRTAPTAQTFPDLAVQRVSAGGPAFPNPEIESYQHVVAAAQVGEAPGALVPLVYPSIWNATFSLPYQASPTSGTLTRTVTFQVGAPESCTSFDADDQTWRFSGLYKVLASEGNNQQPRETNRTSNVSLERTTEENYPLVVANTGAVKFDIRLNANCRASSPDKCVENNDRWYGHFSGPVRPGMAQSSGLEVSIKGSVSLVQIGSTVGAGGIAWGPGAVHGAATNGWTRYRGQFAHPAGQSISSVAVRVEGPGYAHGAVLIDYVCPLAAP